jgi:hypothetical protein
VPVLIKAVAGIFITLSVMRGSAFGTNYNVISVSEVLAAYGTFVFIKFHKILRIILLKYYNKFFP